MSALARACFGAWLLLAATLLHAQATLTASPGTAGAAGYVTATWANVSPTSASHWVGLYTPGAAHSQWKTSSNITNNASGSIPITITSSATGTHELRLFAAGGGYNLLATSNTFTVAKGIIGKVTFNGANLAGVTVTASNGGLCTSSFSTGNYSCGVPSGWSGTVTPSHYQYVFTPTSRSYTNQTANIGAQHYTAAAIYHLTGTVLIAGAPVAGVTLSGTGASCTASDSSGNYDCTVPSGWSGTITPAYSGYSFSPASRNYSNVTSNQASQGYTVVTYQVSGTATLNTIPLANVAVSGTNGASCTTSNTSGEYACTVLAGWSGTVTPSATGYTFTPASRNYSSLAADAPNEDYPATLQTPTATISFVHVDHLNTPRAVSNLSGQTIWRWDQIEPFGVSAPDEDPDGNSVLFPFPFRFPGQYDDKETNLHYNYFRDYAPNIGRYSQSDPVGLFAGVNTYAYVLGRPIQLFDHLGLEATVWRNSATGGPTNGNWGGRCWGGGRYSCGNNGSGDAPPTDSADACYMRHDKCWDRCRGDALCRLLCDQKLVDELRALPSDSRQWPQPPKGGTEGDTERFRQGAIIHFSPPDPIQTTAP